MENLKFKLEICQYETGEISIQASGPSEVSTQEAIGIIEIAKFDLIARLGQREQKEEPLIEVKLTETDFLLDQTGYLKNQGKKIGDSIMLPNSIAKLREESQKLTDEQ